MQTHAFAYSSVHGVTGNLAVMPLGCDLAKKGTSAPVHLPQEIKQRQTLHSSSWEQGQKNKGLLKVAM